MNYLNMDQYVILNERLNDYLESINETFLYQNLELFLKKIFELGYSNIKAISYKPSTEKNVSYNEGFKLISKYLSTLSPQLAEDFDSKLSNGVINLTFHDNFDRAIDNTYIQYSFSKNQDRSLNKIANSKLLDRQEIEVGNYKTTMITFIMLLHEYIHSVYSKNSDSSYFCQTYDDLGEFFSLYFENDFVNFLKKSELDADFFDFYYIIRYNEVLQLLNGSVPSQVLMLYYKDKNGVIDDTTFDDILRKTGLPAKQINGIYNNCMSIDCCNGNCQYFMFIPLAFYYSSTDNPDITRKLLSMVGKLNMYTSNQVFHEIGSSVAEIESIDFRNIMSNMRSEITESNTFKN